MYGSEETVHFTCRRVKVENRTKVADSEGSLDILPDPRYIGNISTAKGSEK